MRKSSIEIEGQKHLLVFSVRVMDSCCDKWGSLDAIEDALSDSKTGLRDNLWLLEQMMVAGDKYAKRNGIENPAPLTLDELLDCYDMTNLAEIGNAIKATFDASNETTVQTESNSKN